MKSNANKKNKIGENTKAEAEETAKANYNKTNEDGSIFEESTDSQKSYKMDDETRARKKKLSKLILDLKETAATNKIKQPTESKEEPKIDVKTKTVADIKTEIKIKKETIESPEILEAPKAIEPKAEPDIPKIISEELETGDPLEKAEKPPEELKTTLKEEVKKAPETTETKQTIPVDAPAATGFFARKRKKRVSGVSPENFANFLSNAKAAEKEAQPEPATDNKTSFSGLGSLSSKGNYKPQKAQKTEQQTTDELRQIGITTIPDEPHRVVSAENQETESKIIEPKEEIQKIEAAEEVKPDARKADKSKKFTSFFKWGRKKHTPETTSEKPLILEKTALYEALTEKSENNLKSEIKKQEEPLEIKQEKDNFIEGLIGKEEQKISYEGLESTPEISQQKAEELIITVPETLIEPEQTTAKETPTPKGKSVAENLESQKREEKPLSDDYEELAIPRIDPIMEIEEAISNSKDPDGELPQANSAWANFLPILGSVLTGFWLVATAAFIYLTGWETVSNYALPEMSLLAISIFIPLVLMWMILSYSWRSQDFRHYTEGVQRQLSLLTYSSEDSEARLSTITESLQSQAKMLTDAANEARSRIEESRESLNMEMSNFGAMSERAAMDAENLGAVLSRRTEDLELMFIRISNEARNAASLYDDSADRMSASGQQTIEQLSEMDNRLGALSQEFNNLMEQRNREIDNLMSNFHGQSQDMDMMGRKALEELHGAADILEQSSTEAADRITESVTQNRLRLLEDANIVSEELANRTEELSEKLASHLSQTVKSLDAQRQSFETAAAQGADQLSTAKTLLEEGVSDMACQMDLMEGSLERSKSLRLSLDSDMHNLGMITDDVSNRTDELINKLENKTGNLQLMTGNTLDRLEELSTELGSCLDNIGSKSSEASHEVTSQLIDIRGELEHSEAAIANLLAKVTSHSTEMKSQTEDVRHSMLDIDNNLIDHKRRAESLSETLKGQVNNFNSLIDSIAKTSEDAGFAIGKAGGSLHDRVIAINSASQSANESISIMGDNLQQNMAYLNAGMENAEARIGVMQSDIQNFVSDAGGVANGLKSSMADMSNSVTGETSRITEQMASLSNNLQSDMSKLMSEAQLMASQSQTLQSQIEQAGSRSDDVANLAEKAIRRMEDASTGLSLRMRELTERSDAVNRNMAHVGDTITRQINEFEDMSSNAMQKASHLMAENSNLQDAAPITTSPSNNINLMVKDMELSTAELRRSNQSQPNQKEDVLDLAAIATKIEEGERASMQRQQARQNQHLNNLNKNRDTNAALRAVQAHLENDEQTQPQKTMPNVRDVKDIINRHTGNRARAENQETNSLSEIFPNKFKAAKEPNRYKATAEETAAMQEESKENFLISARKVVERLNAISVDIHRMIEAGGSDKLLEAYRKGDHGAFCRALLSISAQDATSRIRERFLSNEEFESYISKYIDDFETIFKDAESIKDGKMVISSLTSSDVGRLYKLLCEALHRNPVE